MGEVMEAEGMRTILAVFMVFYFYGQNSCCVAQAVASENPAVSSVVPVGADSALKAQHDSSLRAPANLIRVPKVRQATDYTCCVAALQSILGYYGEDKREDQLAKELKPDPEYGTDIRNLEKAALTRGFVVERKLNVPLDELKKSIDARRPAIVLIQAWSDNPNVDYAADWEDGHCVVGIGYDSENIYIMDPSVLGNYAFIPIPEFLTRWHDVDGGEKVSHLMFSVHGKPPQYNADALLHSN